MRKNVQGVVSGGMSADIKKSRKKVTYVRTVFMTSERREMKTNKKVPEGLASNQGTNEINHLDCITNEKKMPEEILELVDMQRRYSELYDKWWLTGISNVGVHMDLDGFFKVFGDNHDQRDRECDTYPMEYSTTVDGIKFFCIGG